MTEQATSTNTSEYLTKFGRLRLDPPGFPSIQMVGNLALAERFQEFCENPTSTNAGVIQELLGTAGDYLGVVALNFVTDGGVAQVVEVNKREGIVCGLKLSTNKDGQNFTAEEEISLDEWNAFRSGLGGDATYLGTPPKSW